MKVSTDGVHKVLVFDLTFFYNVVYLLLCKTGINVFTAESRETS